LASTEQIVIALSTLGSWITRASGIRSWVTLVTFTDVGMITDVGFRQSRVTGSVGSSYYSTTVVGATSIVESFIVTRIAAFIMCVDITGTRFTVTKRSGVNTDTCVSTGASEAEGEPRSSIEASRRVGSGGEGSTKTRVSNRSSLVTSAIEANKAKSTHTLIEEAVDTEQRT